MLWTSSCAACTTAASRGRSFGTWRRQQTLFVVFSCDGLRRRWSKKARPCFSRRTVENLSAVKKKKKSFLSITAWDRGPNSGAGARPSHAASFLCVCKSEVSAAPRKAVPPPCWRNEEPGAFLEGSKASLYLSPSASMTKYLSRPGTSGIVGSGRRHKLHFYVIPMEKGRAGSRMLFQKILLCYIYCLLGTSLHFCPLILLPHDAPP